MIDPTLLGVLKLSALVVLWGLMAAAVLPLAALGIYVVADKLKLRWLADPVQNALGRLLSLQPLARIVMNIQGGAALTVLGLWSILAMQAGAPIGKVILGTPLLIPFGLWRLWVGVGMARRLKTDR
ncbi:hypothetical protein [uncultured Brevundimonas sp.]|uniref:hypothetical protein n=1 Tax=uncultured Brevundimonas sp. TaxID=213418 RepID=UPI002630C2FB|nr:hypothetical protein [uncultured Brevundimonas sp.]